jgi:hypothetical protein
MNPDLLAKIQSAMDAQFQAGAAIALMNAALNAALPPPAPTAAETPEPPAIDAA